MDLKSFYGRTYQDKTRGGGLGNLLRGALGFFGGIPGRVMSGVMGAKNWAQRTGANIGEEFDEFGQYPTLDRYLNRNTDKYKDKPYRGQGFGYDFSDKGKRSGIFGLQHQNEALFKDSIDE